MPDEAQEAIASLIIDEIKSERGWDRRFKGSERILAEMVGKARAEVAEGGVLPYDPGDRDAE